MPALCHYLGVSFSPRKSPFFLVAKNLQETRHAEQLLEKCENVAQVLQQTRVILWPGNNMGRVVSFWLIFWLLKKSKHTLHHICANMFATFLFLSHEFFCLTQLWAFLTLLHSEAVFAHFAMLHFAKAPRGVRVVLESKNLEATKDPWDFPAPCCAHLLREEICCASPRCRPDEKTDCVLR